MYIFFFFSQIIFGASYTFKFPVDHGAHNDFRSEWWYFTGNLTDANGRNFGYEFTVFRNASTYNSQKHKSEFENDQQYIAHFAVSDIQKNKFYYKEKLGLGEDSDAGAVCDPLKIWVSDWTVNGNYPTNNYYKPEFHIKAVTNKYSILLNLKSDKSLILNGDNGLSRKGPGSDEFSYYYSIPRISTEGTITINNVQYKVSGFSWFDLEWTNSSIGLNSIAWDWFSIQLDNDEELMFYKIKNNGASTGKYNYGAFINKDGEVEKLRDSDVKIITTDFWKSDLTKVYPSGWDIKVSKVNLAVKIKPMMKDQQLKLFTSYWEGAVQAWGTLKNRKITGKGYVELTGY